MLSNALRLLAQNVNFALFLCGFAALYLGISSLSRPFANIVAGSLVMVLSAWPYVKASKR